MQERLKYAVAYIPAWGFYWCGHLLSLLMHRGMEWLFPTYKLLMNWSVFFNDWGGLDVWVDSTKDSNE